MHRAFDGQRLPHGLQELFSHCAALRQAAAHQHKEFITSQPRSLLLCTYAFAQAAGHLHQHLVTHGHAVGVIYGTKVVQRHHQQT